MTSTTHGLAISRNNSVSSIRSEPAWNSRRHQSEPFVSTTTNYRKDSNASQLSATSTASHKKGGFRGLFSRKDPAEKEKKKKEVEKIVLGSKHAAAVKTKLMLDPEYQKIHHNNPHSQTKTTGITEHAPSSHLSAADQEARHPHSGPPMLHGSMNLPMLTRIESHDEPDDEIDEWEEQRREWNSAKEHNLEFIPEIGSPPEFQETSPDGPGGNVRPALGNKRHSWDGSHRKDEAGSGAKTPPTLMPVLPTSGDMRSDLLARSVAERLETAA